MGGLNRKDWNKLAVWIRLSSVCLDWGVCYMGVYIVLTDLIIHTSSVHLLYINYASIKLINEN